MATHLRNIPLSIQDFEKLRSEKCLYVDKTQYMYDLATRTYQVFLGRPRRFGKSLLTSTLKYYFLGRKDLFEGLAVESMEKDWIEYPVIHLDFNLSYYSRPSDLDAVLNYILVQLERKWGSDPSEISYPLRFEGIIQRACEKTGRRVVVLIDEYDKPLLGTLEKDDYNSEMRDMLKEFYGILKRNDAYLRFIFITGVTKFSKVSVFSDLNQLRDISLDKRYDGICGMTEKELIDYCSPEIEELAENRNMTREETLAELKKRYDGYHFASESVGIYNPWSVLTSFARKEFGNYRFETGTPTFLVKMIKDMSLDVRELADDTNIPVNALMDYRIEWNAPIPILYQSGYLTIKKYKPISNTFILGYPNEEVKYGFLNELTWPNALSANGNQFKNQNI